MKRLQHIGLCLLLCTATACNEDTAPPISPNQTTDVPIRWKMQPVEGMQSSRALVEDDGTTTAEEILQDACDADVAGSERIVIWGDYANVINGQQTVQEGFFDGVNLAYYGISAGEDSPTGWDYAGEDRYWTLGGTYKFRAYYPKNGVNIVSSSNATTFVFEWNSIQSQTDLLVAYKEVDTREWKPLNKPVPLDMQHALSALKFNFRFVDGYYTDDKLTGCWLENTKDDDFSCVGIFVYGGSSDAENMTWAGAYAYEPGVEMYKWTYDAGIAIANNSGTDPNDMADDVMTTATAYTGGATSGGQYITNDGWLLVIPQQLSGEVCLCFTTEKGGSNTYRVKIPANTGTDSSYKPGYKYNYTVNISKTNLELDLSIAKWNKLDSSHDIKL